MEQVKKKRVITFGEVMMRLSPPGYAKFSQATYLEFAFGGGEANVAISLAYFGLDTAHVTRFPDNIIGQAATQFLKHHWLDTSWILYGDKHLGKYFLEKGAVHRPSRVVYEREGSAFARIKPEMIDWKEVFRDADWFHWTGITPAISEGAYLCCRDAIRAANEMGVTVSVDMHSRSNLWNYGKSQQEVMHELIQGCNIIIGNPWDMARVFGSDIKESDEFETAAKKLIQLCPGVRKVIDKDRDVISASHNRIVGKMWNGEQMYYTPRMDVTHIIDRVGTGDAFAAGLIYGLLMYNTDEQSLKFAAAACALKHTVEGDANMVTVDDVRNIMEGSSGGSILR